MRRTAYVLCLVAFKKTDAHPVTSQQRAKNDVKYKGMLEKTEANLRLVLRRFLGQANRIKPVMISRYNYLAILLIVGLFAIKFV
jgi:hypothetical protein